MMSSIAFECAPMVREIEHMRELSRSFISEESHAFVMHEWKEQLAQFQNNPHEGFRWSICRDRPIRTIDSVGEYQKDAKGGQTIYATVSSIWQISPGKRKRGQKRCQNFVLSGNGSTVIRVFSKSTTRNDKLLAEWRFDIGAKDSPGCFFHNQINWGLAADNGGRAELDIPRLPTILVTPMDALEFILGELFQDKWPKHATAKSQSVDRWASVQRKRILQLLAWKFQAVKNSRGSPWSSLKRDIPHEDEFIGEFQNLK